MDCLTPAQVRAARAMLDWSMLDLAKASRLSISTVKRFETGDQQPVSNEAVTMMQHAAETEGVHFLADDGNGPGVRFRRR